MLTKTGAKLLDFGLAKQRGRRPPVGGESPIGDGLPLSRTKSESLTEEGMLLGTLEYMAPEQVEGKEMDARSDIFAFGVVLYEMATRRKAFEGESKANLTAAILTYEPPPITKIQPLRPPALERVVQRCLAKDPDERWQTTRDLTSELKWIAEAGGIPRAAAGMEPAWLKPMAKGRKRAAGGWLIPPGNPAEGRFALHRSTPLRFRILALGPSPVRAANGRFRPVEASPLGGGRTAKKFSTSRRASR
jgi:hypothetical protein